MKKPFKLNRLGLVHWKFTKEDSLKMSQYKFILIGEKFDNKVITSLSEKFSIKSSSFKHYQTVKEFRKEVVKQDYYCILQVVDKSLDPSQIEFFIALEDDVNVGFYLLSYDWKFVNDPLALNQIKQRFISIRNGILENIPDELMRSEELIEEEDNLQEEVEFLDFAFCVLTDHELEPADKHLINKVLSHFTPPYPTQFVTNPQQIKWLETGRLYLINFASYAYDFRDKQEQVLGYIHKKVADIVNEISISKPHIGIAKVLHDYALFVQGVEDPSISIPAVSISKHLSETLYRDDESLAANSYEALFASKKANHAPVQKSVEETSAKETSSTSDHASASRSSSYTNLGQNSFNRLGINMLASKGKQVGYAFIAINPTNNQENQILNNYASGLVQGLPIVSLASYKDLLNFQAQHPNFIFNIITFLPGKPDNEGVKDYGFAVSFANWQQMTDSRIQNLLVTLKEAVNAGYCNNFINLCTA